MIITRLPHPFRSIRCRRGTAAIEFALVLPLLLFMFIGAAEVTRYIIIAQKLQKAAYAMADMLAQTSTVTQDELTRIREASRQFMGIFAPPAGSPPPVVFTVLTWASNPPDPCPPAGAYACIMWKFIGGEPEISLYKDEPLGEGRPLPGDPPLMPVPEQSYVVAEINYRFDPILNITGNIPLLRQVLQPATLYYYTVQKVRTGGIPGMNGPEWDP